VHVPPWLKANIRLKVGEASVTLPLKVAAKAAADKVNIIDRVKINLVENLDIDPPFQTQNRPVGQSFYFDLISG
jgi:hypothetical protein